MIRILKTLIKSLWLRLNRPRLLKFQHLEDVPSNYKSNTIYLIGEKNFIWLLTFKCPCGCNEKISLNLLKDADPCWSYKVKKEKISITPSIWRNVNCKSHFVVKEGKINWVK